MKNNPSILSWKTLALIYCAVALSGVLVHDWFLDNKIQDVQQAMHAQVITGHAAAPVQYRVFIFYAAEGLIRCGVPFRLAYGILRFLFTFLAAVSFHYLLSFFFTPPACLIGVLYLFAVLPLTFIRYYMQPMDLPNLFFFLAGYLLIIKRKDFLLVPLLIVAMLNRETAILLVLVYLFFRYDELDLKTLAARSGLLFIAGMGTYILLRKILAVKGYYSDLYYLDSNVADPKVYLYALSLFGPFLFMSFAQRAEKPKFLRRALLFIPFFVVIHFTLTIMAEPRSWLPLLPLIIAAGLWTLLPPELKVAAKPPLPAKEMNVLARYPKAGYALLFGGFLLFFVAFFGYYKNLHLKDRDTLKRVESLLTESRIYEQGGWNERALESLNKALVYRPDDENVQFELATLYDYTLHDPRKALDHYERCIQLNPYHLERDRINSEIERLKYYLERKR